MKDIVIKIYHPELDVISDRTFRSLLKRFSSLLREFQSQEIFYLIENSNLSNSEKQSLRDRLKHPLRHMDSYYIEKIERGSLTIEVMVAASAFFLLQSTIGESVKEAWKEVELHKKIISWLSDPLNEEREDFIDRNIDRVLDNWTIDDFLVESIEREYINEDIFEITINLKTPEDHAEYLAKHYTKKDIDLILSLAQKKIDNSD